MTARYVGATQLEAIHGKLLTKKKSFDRQMNVCWGDIASSSAGRGIIFSGGSVSHALNQDH